MPLYEYECDACGGRFEVIQKFSEVSEKCRTCGKGPVRRLQSAPGIQFKGTGWYVTDYAQKGKSGGESSSGTSGSDGDKSDSKKSDSGSSDTSTKSDSTKSESSTSTTSTPGTTTKD
jgi:putative FmdB family regulatory protein